MAINPKKTAMKIITGAATNRTLSAADGVINSFCINFRISARVCSVPYFPVSIGPRRSWTKPAVYAERKIAGFGQERLGPTETGKYGTLPTQADILTLIRKEHTTPSA